MTEADRDLSAFLINLDSRPDRLVSCTERLERADVPFERVRARTPEDARAMGVRSSSPAMHEGWVAVVASHLAIYEMVLERKLPYALIMEDDILPGIRFRTRLLRGLASLPPGWMVYQAGWVDLAPLHRWPLASLLRSVAGPIVPGTDLVMAMPFRHGTHAYVVTPEFAAYGLEHFGQPHFASDGLIEDHSNAPPLKGRCFVNLPSLALQDQSPSTVNVDRAVEGFPAWRRWIA